MSGESIPASSGYQGISTDDLELFKHTNMANSANHLLYSATQAEIEQDASACTYTADDVPEFLEWLYDTNSRSHYIGCTLTTLTNMSHMAKVLENAQGHESLRNDLVFALGVEEKLFSLLGIISLVQLENTPDVPLNPQGVLNLLSHKAIDFRGDESISPEVAAMRDEAYVQGRVFFEASAETIQRFVDPTGEDAELQEMLAAMGHLYTQGDLNNLADLADLTEKWSTIDSRLLDALVVRNSDSNVAE
jgi:hypothetical protein